MTPTEYPFTPGYCSATLESAPGYQQRHMLYAAWEDGGLMASDQAYPKIPTRRYTADNLDTAPYDLRDVWCHLRGPSSKRLINAPNECRIYRDDTVVYVAYTGTVWVIPNDGKLRTESFTASTFRDSWLFEGGALPSTVTSRPAAMAAFAYAGLV